MQGRNETIEAQEIKVGDLISTTWRPETKEVIEVGEGPSETHVAIEFADRTTLVIEKNQVVTIFLED